MTKITIAIVFTFLYVITGFAQTKNDSIYLFLKNKGFQNISVCQQSKKLYVKFDNGSYRWTPFAIAIAEQELKKFIGNTDTIILIPSYHQIPLLNIVYTQDIDSSKTKKIDAISIGDRHTADLFSKSQKFNSSLGKVDLVLYPHVRVQFGNYNNPVETQLGISPMLRTSLWKGMSINLQMLFLIQDDMQGSSGKKIYPGIVSVNQLFKLPLQVYGSINVGFFPFNRQGVMRHFYGSDIQLRKYILNGNVYFGINGSLTGEASFEGNQLEYWQMDKLNGSICLAYRYKPYDLWIKASAGRYVYDDYGVRFDVNRQFKELQIGFFAVKSNMGQAGGFNFKIPIIPKRYYNQERFRIRPTETFDWEFRVNTTKNCVMQYKTGNDIDDLMINSNPDYVKKQVDLIEK